MAARGRSKKVAVPAPYRWATDDPLAAEHKVISAFVEEAARAGWQYHLALKMNAWHGGQILARTNLEGGARYVRALVDWVLHYEVLAHQFVELTGNRTSFACEPEWDAIWTRRMVAAESMGWLMRRKLPLTEADLARVTTWIIESDQSCTYPAYPVSSLVAALQRFAQTRPTCPELANRVARFAVMLREFGPQTADWAADMAKLSSSLAPKAGPRNSKRESCCSKAPVKPEKLAATLYEALVGGRDKRKPGQSPPTQQLAPMYDSLNAEPAVQVCFVKLTLKRVAEFVKQAAALDPDRGGGLNPCHASDFPHAAALISEKILCRKLPYTDADFVRLINWTAASRPSMLGLAFLRPLIARVEVFAGQNPVSGALKRAVRRLIAALDTVGTPADTRLAGRLGRIARHSVGEARGDRARTRSAYRRA